MSNQILEQNMSSQYLNSYNFNVLFFTQSTFQIQALVCAGISSAVNMVPWLFPRGLWVGNLKDSKWETKNCDIIFLGGCDRFFFSDYLRKLHIDKSLVFFMCLVKKVFFLDKDSVVTVNNLSLLKLAPWRLLHLLLVFPIIELLVTDYVNVTFTKWRAVNCWDIFVLVGVSLAWLGLR